MAATAAKKKPGTQVAPRANTSVVSIQEQVKKDLAELQNRTGAPGGDMIRVTQDKQFLLPDGTKHPGPLQLVIVDFVTHKTFYDRAFDKSNITPPACFAISANPKDMVPSKDSPARQSDACHGCPLNEFGSDGDGKACKEKRVMAVIPADADANTDIAILTASVTALKGFDSYVRSVGASLGKMPYQLITEVSFDPNQTYASLRFGNPQPASPDLVQTAFALREKARDRLLAPYDVSGYKPPQQKARPAARAGARR